MKIVVTGRKSSVAGFIDCAMKCRLCQVECPEFYHHASESQRVTVVLWTFYEFFDLNILREKRFKNLTFTVDTSTAKIEKQAGACNLIWESKVKSKAVESGVGETNFEDEEVKLDSYSTLELYEEILGYDN